MGMIDPRFNSTFGQTPLRLKDKFVTYQEYNEWHREYIFDSLRGLRYGQSFCNRYGLTDDYVLYYMTNQTNAELYIRKYYIV